MKTVFLDFESYYDKEYSLGKLPTMQYIRDPRFKLLGCAIWTTGMGSPDYLHTFEECREFFTQADLSQCAVVAHNAAFDAAILTHHFHIKPAYCYDTKLMARYLIAQGELPPDQTTSLAALTNRKGDTAEAVAAGGDDLAEYAINDLKLLMELFIKFYSKVPEFELDLMDLHVDMAINPVVRLDKSLLEQVAAQKPHPLAVKLRKKQPLIDALAACGISPEYKPSPSNPDKQVEAFAKTDEFMQKLAVHPDPVVRKIHQLRTEGNSNLKQTRAQRFLDVGEPLPVCLLYYGSHTGRSSGQDKLNQQNLPKKGVHRRSMMPPPGHKFIKIDLSQIEVRVLGWLAGDKNMLDIFEQGLDPYKKFAAEVMFRKAYDDVTKEERTQCKPVILGEGFGMSEAGLAAYAANMGIIMPAQQIRDAVQGYKNKFVRVVAYWQELMRVVRSTGELVLPNGRKLTYPDRFYEGRNLAYKRHAIFSKKHKGKRDTKRIWHGLLAENITQATARDVVMWQTLKLAEKYKVVLSVHDEVVLCVPNEQAEEALQVAYEVFATAPPWAPDLPVEGEGSILDTYQ